MIRKSENPDMLVFAHRGVSKYYPENTIVAFNKAAEMNVDSVIITGVMTDLCCETTARDAFTRGFRVYFMADATATNTEERHLASLRAISRGFGEVLTSKELELLL